ncbi:MAG: HD domain-containing protein [Anaerolineaceae bacterium]
MKIEALMELLPENYNFMDRELVMKAYRFAEKAHERQTRVSGEPYITHCVAVASILAELKVPPAIVISGLLHDTVEDTNISLQEIKSVFGDEVARLVDGVTKLTNLPRVTRGDQLKNADGEFIGDEIEDDDSQSSKFRKKDLSNETLRKVFLAMGDDIRVVLIKLADRLHNMRTLGYMPEAKRKRIAQETLDIFAPLANRLGIWQIKWELEDLGFRYVNPEKYKEIANNLALRRKDRESEIISIEENLKKILSDTGIKVEISGRSKHIYSIYRKMQEKDKPFESVLVL